MNTFKEYIPTLTLRETDIVRAVLLAVDRWILEGMDPFDSPLDHLTRAKSQKASSSDTTPVDSETVCMHGVDIRTSCERCEAQWQLKIKQWSTE